MKINENLIKNILILLYLAFKYLFIFIWVIIFFISQDLFFFFLDISFFKLLILFYKESMDINEKTNLRSSINIEELQESQSDAHSSRLKRRTPNSTVQFANTLDSLRTEPTIRKQVTTRVEVY